jgi:NAD(P)-dependent dehydrogenase (short-subunit alcohol dehydrogenase family)
MKGGVNMPLKKTVIVTGGNTGIGKAIAVSLAKQGCHVVIISRNAEKGKDALADIINLGENKNIELVIGDLGTIDGVKKLADELIIKYPDARVLINNAGVWLMKKSINVDGLEQTFMVNHLAPFILSTMLFKVLKNNAPSRIVNVNAGLYVFGKFNPEKTPYGKDFGMVRTYMNSKLCNVMFTRDFAVLLKGSGVTINALHPGVINTGLGVSKGFFGNIIQIMKKNMSTPEEGAEAPVHLALATELEGISGRFFMLSEETPYNRNALNEEKSKYLRDLSIKLTGVTL